MSITHKYREEGQPCPLCKSTAGKPYEVGCGDCPVDSCGSLLLPPCPFCGTEEPETHEVTDPIFEAAVICSNDVCGVELRTAYLTDACERWINRVSNA